MKLTIQSDHLSKVLSSIKNVIESRPTLPVLSHVLLEADKEREILTLTGTNLEQYIIQKVVATVTEPGKLAVPWKLFNDLVGTFPKDTDIELSVFDVDDLIVKCGKTEATLRGIDAAEFPLNPRVMDEGTILAEFVPLDLKELLEQVIYAAATDESRPILTGVYIEGKEGVLSFVTADGFRLAWRQGESMMDGSFAMPGKTAQILIDLLDDEPEDVSLFMDETGNAVHWRLNTADVVTQLLEGNFVNYRQIIPKSHETRITVEKDELVKLLKRADLFVRGLHIVTLDIRAIEGYAEGHLYIRAQGTGDDNVGVFDANIRVELTGEPVTFAVNSRFMVDALVACGTERVTIDATNAARPIVVKPVGRDDYLCVVMPMHMRE